MAEFIKGEIEFRGDAPYPLPVVQYATAYAEGTLVVVEASISVRGVLQPVLVSFTREAAAAVIPQMNAVLEGRR